MMFPLTKERQNIRLPTLLERKETKTMRNINKLLSLAEKGNALCIIGKGGVGKTRVLEALYVEGEKEYDGNVLFIHAPSRIRESYPSFIVKDREREKEMWDIIKSVESIDDYNGLIPSSKEIMGIIYTFIKNGVLKRDSLLIIDNLDALMDTYDLKSLLSLLELMKETKEVKIILSVSSIIGVRAVESFLSFVKFFEVKREKEEEVEIEEKESSEEVYSFFMSLMEDL